MSRSIRILLWAGGGLVVLLVLVALLLPALVDVNRYRDLIEGRAEEALGRDVHLGEMKLTVLPALGIRIQDLRIGALPGEGADDLLSARSLRVGARLLPLLSKRLEVSSLLLVEPSLVLERGPTGEWNLQRLLADEGAGPESGGEFSVGLLRITGGRVVVRDAGATEGRWREVAISDLDIRLRNLAPGRELDMDLSAALSLAPGCRVSVAGKAGPLSAGDGPIPVDLALALEHVPLAAARPYLEDYAELAGDEGTLDLRLSLSGQVPEAFDASGQLSLHDAAVRLQGLDAVERTVPLEVALDYDVGAAAGGDRLEIRRFKAVLGGNELALQGTLDRSGPVTLGDLSLLPSRVRADDLAGLLALLGVETPVSFTSSRPMEIQAAVRGPLGGEELPEIEATLTVSGLALRHPDMAEALEEVSGTVALAGETLEVSGFSGRMGSSDVAGTMSVEGLDTPRVRFDLHSRRADFWELLSFLSGAEEEAGGPGGPGGASASEEAPVSLRAEGTLRIEQGSFRDLEFKDLDAGLKLDGQRLVLDPFRMNLYEGTFQGAATLDLAVDPPGFQLHSDVEGIEMEPLLAQNLDSPDLLSGRFGGVLDARGAGSDYESVVAGLQGNGRVEVADGHLGKLDVLKMLSKATGVFGEDTLHALSRKLEQGGTDFRRLSGTLKLEGEQMSSDDLVLESPDLILQGAGTVDLLQATLDGDFLVVFSEELSRSMKDEGSRAAQVFWDPGLDRVSLPVGLSGPFEAPAASIDWKTTARRAAGKKVQDEVRQRLGGLLGGGKEQEPEADREPSQEVPAEAVSEAPAAAGPLGAAITRARWGGSILLKDLKIEGTVQGANLERALLVVTDARGREVHRTKSLREIRDYLRKDGADPAKVALIEWDATVDGKELVGARSPFTITVEVLDREGQSATASREVEK